MNKEERAAHHEEYATKAEARKERYAAKSAARKQRYADRRTARRAKAEKRRVVVAAKAADRKKRNAESETARRERRVRAQAENAERQAEREQRSWEVVGATDTTSDLPCAVGPCQESRAPGSSYCPKHGPTKAAKRKAARAAAEPAKTVDVVQYHSAAAFETDAQWRTRAGWMLAGQSQVTGQTHRTKKAIKRGLVGGLFGVPMIGAASGLLSGKRDTGTITVTWVRQPPGVVQPPPST